MRNIRIKLTWNGKTVLEGTCSAVMALDTVHMFAGNFVNPKKAGFMAPALVDLVNATAGAVFEGEFGDETGRASFLLVVS
jgi:hypothetical protein